MIASATCRAFDADLAIRGAHARIPRSIFFIGINTPIRQSSKRERLPQKFALANLTA